MRRRLPAALALLVPCAAAAVAVAATPKPVVVHDAKGDVRSPLDLTRFSLGRGADGRVRASLTLATAWDGSALVARSGPPGSLCVKAWTVTASPADDPPDYLVCVTADAKGTLRGSVLHERANKLPERVASAVVSRPSTRTVTLRFAQSAVGSPARLRAVAESTRPGCPRVSCIDLAPEAGVALVLNLKPPA